MDWENTLKVKRHISGNFFELTDGTILNSKNNMIIDPVDLPSTMKYDESMGSFPLYRRASDFPRNDGDVFVTVDVVLETSLSESGKTEYVKFENFDYINNGWAKVYGKFTAFNHGFKLGEAYLLQLEVNPNYPSNLKLIKSKKLNADKKEVPVQLKKETKKQDKNGKNALEEVYQSRLPWGL